MKVIDVSQLGNHLSDSVRDDAGVAASCCWAGRCWCGQMVNVRRLDGRDGKPSVVQRDRLHGVTEWSGSFASSDTQTGIAD